MEGPGLVARIGDRGGDGPLHAGGVAAAATSSPLRPRGRRRAEVAQAARLLLLLPVPQGGIIVGFAGACVVRSLRDMYNGLLSLVYVN